MKKMKLRNLLIVLLAVCMLCVCCLTACQNTETPDTDPPAGSDPSEKDPPAGSDPSEEDPPAQEWTVTFDSNGGTATQSKTTVGGKVSAPTDVLLNGYEIEGWYNGANKWDFANDKATSDITLKANWQKNSNVVVSEETPLDLSNAQYQVVSYDGAWIDGMNVDNYTETVILTTYNAAIPGDYGIYMSAAKEWNDAKLSAFKVEINGEEQATLRLAPTGNWGTIANSNVAKVSFVQGVNYVRLTVDSDLVSDKVDAVEKIKSITILNAYPEYTYLPQSDGSAYFYKDDIDTDVAFGGKYNNAYRSESSDDEFSITVNTKTSGNYDVALYAARPSSADAVDVWVTVNNQTAYDVLRVNQLASQDNRENSFKLQPSVNLALNAGENVLTFHYADGANVSSSNYIELMWISVKYSDNQSAKALVTFNGEGVKEYSVYVNVGSVVSQPSDPYVEDKYFDGWYNGSEKWNFSTPVTGNLTLTARYVESVLVEFEGEPNVQSVTIKSGTCLDKDSLSYTLKAGYTVAYWEDDDMTVPFDFDEPITEDTTIYTSYVLVALQGYTATEINLSDASYENVSFDGEKIDWGQQNGSVTFTYTVESEGTYGMYLQYARDIKWNGDKYRKPQYRVTVNNVAVEQVFTLVPTYDWSDICLSNVISLHLNQGQNTIVLSTVSNDQLDFLAHIRKAFILDGMPEYDMLPQNIQAAGANISGCNSQYDGKFVDFNHENASVEVSVRAQQASQVNVSLMYAGNFEGTITVEIFVNGESVGEITVSASGSRDDYGLSSACAVTLSAGINTVKVVCKSAANGGEFDLSAIRIAASAD